MCPSLPHSHTHKPNHPDLVLPLNKPPTNAKTIFECASLVRSTWHSRNLCPIYLNILCTLESRTHTYMIIVCTFRYTLCRFALRVDIARVVSNRRRGHKLAAATPPVKKLAQTSNSDAHSVAHFAVSFHSAGEELQILEWGLSQRFSMPFKHWHTSFAPVFMYIYMSFIVYTHAITTTTNARRQKPHHRKCEKGHNYSPTCYLLVYRWVCVARKQCLRVYTLCNHIFSQIRSAFSNQSIFVEIVCTICSYCEPWIWRATDVVFVCIA